MHVLPKLQSRFPVLYMKHDSAPAVSVTSLRQCSCSILYYTGVCSVSLLLWTLQDLDITKVNQMLLTCHAWLQTLSLGSCRRPLW